MVEAILVSSIPQSIVKIICRVYINIVNKLLIITYKDTELINVIGTLGYKLQGCISMYGLATLNRFCKQCIEYTRFHVSHTRILSMEITVILCKHATLNYRL